MDKLNYNDFTDVLIKQTRKYGEKDLFIFLADGEDKVEKTSYKQFLEQTLQLAANLQNITNEGDRVLILCPPGIRFNLAFFGCLFAQVIPIPLYPPDTRSLDRVVNIINDCSPEKAITNFNTIQKYSNIEIESTNIAELKTKPIVSSILNNVQLIDIESIKASNGEVYQQKKIDPYYTAYLQYTSGSTSSPKGVMVTHDNLVHNSYHLKKLFGQSENDCAVSWIPPFHDMGLIREILGALYSGSTLVFMSPNSFLRKPLRWLKAISKYSAIGPVISGGPNFAYDLCVKHITEEEKSDLDLSSWKLAYNGSEPVRENTLISFYNSFKDFGFGYKSLAPGYGLAEATLLAGGPFIEERPVIKYVDKELLQNNIISFKGKDDENAQTMIGCGRIIPDQETIIVNPDTLKRCQEKEVGEIWIKGRSVAKGYYKNLEETERTFKAYLADEGHGPFLRTGDLGYVDDNNIIYITGRLKDLIIINGNNHYPQDIEQTAGLSHEALRINGGIAFSINVDDAEKLVVVYGIKRNVLNEFDPEEIKQKIKHAIFQKHGVQVYKIVFIELSSLPKTSSGKLQRKLCRKQFLENSLKEIKYETSGITK